MNEQISELLEKLHVSCASSESHGYVDFPYPSPLDELIERLVAAYKEAWELDSPTRKRILDSVTVEVSNCLLVYGHRMAVLAVRQQSREPLEKALLALVVEGFRCDARENMLILSLINHSAVKVGADPRQLFENAARYASPEVAQHLREFVSRRPEDKSIQAMGYSEETTPDGFRYSRNW